MNILIVSLTILLSFFATAVMSFITMAVPIGPWIDVTLVLLGTLLVRLVAGRYVAHDRNEALGLSAAAGSLGGSIATACGFAFPTLYFLDKDIFLFWMNSPVLFCSIMAGLVITAGGLGLLLVDYYEDAMLAQRQLSFPIGQLMNKMIMAQNSVRKAYELVAGLLVSTILGGVDIFTSLLPRKIVALAPHAFAWITIPEIVVRPDWMPMLWAIGFVAGHVLVVPLIVGIGAKIFFVDVLHSSCFGSLAYNDFLFAFCSGIVVYGVALSFFDARKSMVSFVKNWWKNGSKQAPFSMKSSMVSLSSFQAAGALGICSLLFLTYFNFSLVAQLYLIIFTAFCVYQLMLIGGMTGMAPVARYATFVLVPGLFLFGFDSVQVALISTFVEISGMVAVDALFGRKMAFLTNISREKMRRYQWLGLMISACVIGAVFFVLVNHFGIGSENLPAQRCLTRALLVNTLHSQQFNYIVMLCGALFGVMLKFVKVNPTMVLTGLLLPIDFSILLIGGGLSTYLTRDREEWYPFWSGIFAASALWMLVKAFVGAR